MENKSPSEFRSVLCDELLDIITGSFGIAINLSDFFNTACADMIIIHPADLQWILPLYKKYGWDGVYAAVTFISLKVPLAPNRTKEFKEALAEIEIINPKVYSEY